MPVFDSNIFDSNIFDADRAFTASAVLHRVAEDGFGVEASIVAYSEATLTAGAILRAIVSFDLPLDAVVLDQTEDSFDIGAVLTSVVYELTADAIIRRTSEAALTVDAVIGRVLWEDSFTRTIASGEGWGPPYVDYRGDKLYPNRDAGVDGSAGYVEPSATPYWDPVGHPRPISGTIQFDFWVPASTGESQFWFGMDGAIPDGTFEPSELEVYSDDYNEGTTWGADIWPSDLYYTFVPERSTWYTLKGYFDGTLGGGTPCGVKVWKRDDPEPAEWSMEGTHSTYAYWRYWNSRTWVDGYYAEQTKVDNLRFVSTQLKSVTNSEFAVGAWIIDTTQEASLTASAIVFRTMGDGSSSVPQYGSIATATSDGSNNLPIGKPADTASGDSLIAIISFDAQGSTTRDLIPDLAGWTQIGKSTPANGDHSVTFWTRLAGASEPSTYNFNLTPIVPTTGTQMAGAIMRVTGPVGSVQFWKSAVSWASTAHPVPASLAYPPIPGPDIYTSLPGLLVYAAGGASAGATWTPPTGMTERADIRSAAWASLEVATEDVTDGLVGWRAAASSYSVIDVLGLLLVLPPGRFFQTDAWVAGPPVTETKYGTGALDAWIIPTPLPHGDDEELVDISIKINGVDVTDDVLFKEAEFDSQVSGSPGLCKFRLKDMSYAYSITVGQEITLDINGRRMWGGFVQSVNRQFFFPYTGSPLKQKRITGLHGNPCLDIDPVVSVPRALLIEGVDYNILLRKRFLYDKEEPENGELKSWPAGTHDDVQIKYMCQHFLDLTDDGIDYVSKVEYVGSPNPDERGNPAGGGWSWEDALRAVSRYPGAIYYIDPNKQLVYTDVDTPNSGYTLTDTPQGDYELGYREMEILFNGSNLRNDAMVWGAGQGANRVRFQRTRDQDSIDEHGLWQVGDFRGDMWRQESVNKRSRSFVYGSPQNKRGGKDDAVSVSVSLFKPAFRVAEKVTFVSGIHEYTDVLPVRRMRITFPTTTSARFDLVLSHAIDEPWNTFEYWFPKLPPIEYPPPEPTTTIDNCPVPNYPWTWESEDGTLAVLGGFFPVFGDDFNRASGQPSTLGGWWESPAGTLKAPTINADGSITIDSYNGQTIRLKTPISSDIQVICALDLPTWANWQLTLGAADYGSRLFELNDDGRILLTSSYNYLRIPSSLLNGKVYVRAVVYKDYFCAIKIWPQSEPEPFNWTATGDMGIGPVAYYNARTYFDLTFRGNANLMGVSVWANSNSEPELANLGLYGAGSWVKHWDTPPPDDGPYAVSWGTDSETSGGGGEPSQTVSAAWWYFDPLSTPDNGAINGASASIKSVYIDVPTSQYWDEETFYEKISLPTSMRIKGKMTVGFGQSGGIIASRVPQLRQIYAVIYVIPAGTDATTPPYWIGEPFFRAGGRIVWGGLFTCGTQGGWLDYQIGDTMTIEFETESFDLSEYSDPQGNNTGKFTYGCAIWDPVALLRSLDPSGGPFMLPNTASCSASLSDIELLTRYESGPTGIHFCIPNSSGGTPTSESKNCQGYQVSVTTLDEAIDTGENWTVVLDNAYQPGSVEVYVDGVPAKPAIDYIESSPIDGVVTFLNSFLYAKEVTVCYFPES